MRGYTIQHIDLETMGLKNTHVRGDISYGWHDEQTGLYYRVRVERPGEVLCFDAVLCYFREDYEGQWEPPATHPNQRFSGIHQNPTRRKG